MNFIDSYSGLNSPDRDRFAKICRKLLAVTFIVKDKDEQVGFLLCPQCVPIGDV